MSRVLEQREKRARIKALLEAKNLDAVVLKKGANVAWIIGGRAHIPTTLELSCMDVVVYRDRIVVVTNKIEAPRLEAEELMQRCRTFMPKAAAASCCQQPQRGDEQSAEDDGRIDRDEKRKLKRAGVHPLLHRGEDGPGKPGYAGAESERQELEAHGRDRHVLRR